MWQARFATPRAGELHLRPFLLGSTVCDCDHPAVAALSLELVGRCTSVAEAAASVRAWVREHIVYTLQDKSDLASQTLAKREGMCTNKANLQVALLRAAGIAPDSIHAANSSALHVGAPLLFLNVAARHTGELELNLWADRLIVADCRCG